MDTGWFIWVHISVCIVIWDLECWHTCTYWNKLIFFYLLSLWCPEVILYELARPTLLAECICCLAMQTIVCVLKFMLPFTRKKTNGDHGASSSQPFAQQQQLAVQQDSYMQSRAEALQNVESTIHELSNIFTQLATMVSQQGELAIRWTSSFKFYSTFFLSIVHKITAHTWT